MARFVVVLTMFLGAWPVPALEQGVSLTFSQGGKTDGRSARLVSLYVPEGTSPTPFLAPGSFTATFSGFVNLRLRGEYAFSVLGRGKVVVKLKDQVILEATGDDFGGKSTGPIKLDKGKNPVEVIYMSPEKGDAAVRLLWSSRDFPPEPVQTTVLLYDSAAIKAAMTLREGRELVGTLRCTRCHEVAKREGAVAMPEMASDAPDLSQAGARLKRDWMAVWIADPKSLRPDASMPKGATDAAASDLAAYLAGLGKPAASAQTAQPAEDVVKQGGQLFAALGCIGCHTKPDAEEFDKAHGRVPLKYVNAKFQPGALRAWLMNPQAHYAWTRMPNFRLNELEADRLEAFLTSRATGKVKEGNAGDPKKGELFFLKLGCANCHSVAGLHPVAQGRKLETLDLRKECARDFGLSDGQRGAIAAFVKGGTAPLWNEALPEFAERAVRRFQCTACHALDEVEHRWSTLAEEVAELMPPETNIESDQNEEAKKGPKIFYPRGLGKLHGGDEIVVGGDQSRPSLTWAGEKLNPDWAGAFIAGETQYKPRYWLRSRMPSFPVQARGIAEGLALSHGVPAKRQAVAGPKVELADVGQKLISRDGGFACVTCHSVGDSKATSPFEAPGLNFVHVTERLTGDYYMRWMRKPMRFQPGTKMPQFSEDGKTNIKEVFDGDADRQFDAVWNYLLQGEKMVAPE